MLSWKLCVTLAMIVLTGLGKLQGERQHYFKECASLRGGAALIIWLGSDGNCYLNCQRIQNCTTFSGNLVVRQSLLQSSSSGSAVQPSFPDLTEITGYLIFFFIRKRKDLKSMFPNLAVIRGDYLFINYALVIYQTDLTQIDLRSLTVIKRGGVRIERNDRLCYVRSVRWESIMLEKGQDESNFGIVLSNNNKNCYDVCYTRQCYAPRGHGRSGIQYCWGPGYKQDMQCQRLCDGRCGSSGCVKGTYGTCCHQQCLGGCSKEGSPKHCFACKYYRGGPDGTCVDRCPKGKYLIDNFKCHTACPYWNSIHSKRLLLALGWHFYSLNGVCVQKCPAGYIENTTSSTCDRCVKAKCPRVCKISGIGIATISDLSDIKKYQLLGCTTIDGSLRIQIRGGSSEIISTELYKSLGTIETIRGYLSITESVPLRSLNFLSKLKSVEPNGRLALDRYAVAVFDNPNLKALWKITHDIKITKGKLFFHLNPNLCPEKIREFQKATGRNSSVDDISESTNGNEIICNVKKINASLTEVHYPKWVFGKSIRVKWLHDRSIDSRILPYYEVHYGIVPNENVNEQYGRDSNSNNSLWKKVDKKSPGFDASGTRYVQMEIILKGLKPFSLYGVYVEGRALKGQGRKSNLLFLKTSPAYPSAPLGLEAGFLSPNEIKITWNKPDEPNGIISHYKIYYSKITYSVWKDDIDWCTRDLHLTENRNDQSGDKGPEENPNGSCPRNYTCPCEVETKKSKAIESDRNAQLFKKEFEDKVLNFIFVKPKRDKKGKRSKRRRLAKQSVKCSGNKVNDDCKPKSAPPQTRIPKRSSALALATLLGKYKKFDYKTPKNSTVTMPPGLSTTSKPTSLLVHEIRVNSTKKLEHVLKNLDYFQDYLIRVCACNEVGCTKPMKTMSEFDKCAGVTGRTDINNTADSMENLVTVQVRGEKCQINWLPPPKPNGVVLKYDIAIRSSSGNEIIHCHLRQNPTTFTYEGLPGNYTVKIRAISPAGNGSWTTPISFAIVDINGGNKGGGKGTNQSAVIGIGIAAALAMVALIIFVVYYAMMKKKTDKGIPGVLYASVNPEYMNKNLVYIEDEWEVPREKIELVKELGQGSFGMVYEGIAFDIVPGKPECRVAVKTVNEKANAFERMEFLKEASVMKAFDCNHVVRLIGVVSKGQPSLVVMELMGSGDLKTFLRKRRPKEKGSLRPPTLEETLQMAAEIADGMAYLASRKFVHRDLAARNCMVASDFTVKIGDFGMTRDVYETDYYRKGGKGLLPVRWMAPESLKDGLFTAASDVWSYGVVLWEMATLAAQPYTGQSNEEVLKFVINGGVLERPEGCPERLYYLMNICWRRETKERPTFLEIINLLENDVNDSFRKLSFYNQRLTQNEDGSISIQSNMPRSGATRRDVAISRGKMNHITDEETVSDLSSVESTSEEHWKPEADRSLEPIDYEPSMSARRTISLYDNDGTPETENNMRYDEGSKGSKGSRGSRGFRYTVPTIGRYSLGRSVHV